MGHPTEWAEHLEQSDSTTHYPGTRDVSYYAVVVRVISGRVSTSQGWSSDTLEIKSPGH